MYSGELLEHRILEWYITHYVSHKKALTTQISSSRVTEREFTSGVGVFVSFVVQDKRYKLNPDYALDEDSSATIGFQGKAGSRRITEVTQGFPTQHWKSRVVLLSSKLV